MTEETREETALPANIRRLWGLESQKAPRTGLSVGRVVQAAMEVADAEGLAAVSMARVAKQLGFTTMALYRHVDSKEELLELMTDAAAGAPPEDVVAAGDWRDGLRRWTRSMLGLYDERPWVADLSVSSIPIGPGQLAWMEAGMQVLREVPLTDTEKFSLVTVLAGYVRGEATLRRDLTRGAVSSGREWHEVEDDWSRNLAAVLDPERFPELSKMVASWVVPPAETDGDVPQDEDFAFGLERILDGVELLIRKRTAGEA